MVPLSPLAHPPKLTHPSAPLLIGYDAMNASRVDDRLPPLHQADGHQH